MHWLPLQVATANPAKMAAGVFRMAQSIPADADLGMEENSANTVSTLGGFCSNN